MKRLLMVTTVPATVRAFLLPFARHFRKLGWRVDAMARGISQSTDCIAHFDHVWDVGWSRNPLDPQNLATAPAIVREVARRERYDLVHVHTPVAGFVTRFALRHLRTETRTKVIYTAHGFHFYPGGDPVRNFIFQSLEQIAGPWTDYLVVINREDHKAAQRLRLVPSERLVYMPGIGIDTQHYAPEQVSEDEVLLLRREIGVTPETPLFSMIAAFTPNKRHRDAVRALAQMENREVHLAFAGSGPLMDNIRSLAAQLGVRNRVHFLGYRKDIPVLIKASVATLLPSEREGLPRVVMESMSLGVPVIGSKTRGISDLLADDAGILVNVGDTDALARAMEWVLREPEKASQLANRARHRIVSYDLRLIIRMHEELYSKALCS